MWLGLTNQIVDDSDSKPANFDRRFRSDSKYNDESELAIAILIWFDLFLIKIDQFRSDFDLFSIKTSKTAIQMLIIKSKTTIYVKKTIYIENLVVFDNYRLYSTNFRYESNYFRCKWSGFESDCRDE